jgi:hypothetical protein
LQIDPIQVSTVTASCKGNAAVSLQCFTLVQCSAETNPGFFLEGRLGVQKIQLRTEGREYIDVGKTGPYSVVPISLYMSETNILIMLFWVYFPGKWEFGSICQKLSNVVSGTNCIITNLSLSLQIECGNTLTLECPAPPAGCGRYTDVTI